MANIKHMEMAPALSQNQHISFKSSFFGLCQKAVYEPTQSALKSDIREYTPTDGERLERLLALPLDKLNKALEEQSAPASVPIGQYCLETCVSADGQFAAVQLFRFSDFSYKPVSDFVAWEGKDAAIVKKLVR